MAREPRGGVLAALALAGLVLVAGCSSEPQDPAEARRERVEARLDATFSRQQARCIMGELDERALIALDATTDLPADGPALETYTAAVTTCVTGEG